SGVAASSTVAVTVLPLTRMLLVTAIRFLASVRAGPFNPVRTKIQAIVAGRSRPIAVECPRACVTWCPHRRRGKTHANGSRQPVGRAAHQRAANPCVCVLRAGGFGGCG